MASTYVNDLRLNELATGDGSGTWGTTTNTNLELIAEGLSFGTEAITTNADTHTSTVADGATDPARSIYIKYTGTLDSACTITIAPNTLSRLHFIENGTSGSQNIIISQGSGANVTIPPGDVKVVYLDGAGSGAAVVDAFASLSVVDLKVQDDLTVTDDATVGGTLGVTGTTTLSGILDITDTTDASDATGDTGALRTEGGASIAKKLYVGTDLDVDGTTNLDVVDIDGAVDMASTLQVDGAITSSSGATITTADNTAQLTLSSTDADANSGPVLLLQRDSGSPADGDNAGLIQFKFDNSAGSDFVSAAQISAKANDVTDGTEDGELELLTIVAGSSRSRIEMLPGEVVINEDSIDSDFRVESDNTTHALFVEGSSGNVGIGDSDPGRMLHIKALSTATAGQAALLMENEVGTTGEIKQGPSSDNAMIFTENGGERARINTSGDLLVGGTEINPQNQSSGTGSALRADGRGLFRNTDSTVLAANLQGDDGEVVRICKDGATAGKIGTVSGDIFISNAVDVGLYFESTTTDNVAPCTIAGVKRDNAIDLGASGARFKDGFFSGALYIGGTGSANALNDYEEGDWTPDIRQSGTAVSDAAYNTSFTGGQYTKIGRLVQMTCSIRLTDKGTVTASNGFQIGGLPFASTNNIKARSAVSLYNHLGAGIDMTGNTNGTLMGLLSHNEDEITFRVEDFSGTTGEAVLYEDVGDTLYLQLAFSFITG
jgi:hypothetical protein